MSTNPLNQWPDDPLERLEAKLDAYRDEHRLTIYGDPSDPARIGLDGRVRNNERDIAAFKRGGLATLAVGSPLLLDWIKRKFGIGQ